MSFSGSLLGVGLSMVLWPTKWEVSSTLQLHRSFRHTPLAFSACAAASNPPTSSLATAIVLSINVTRVNVCCVNPSRSHPTNRAAHLMHGRISILTHFQPIPERGKRDASDSKDFISLSAVQLLFLRSIIFPSFVLRRFCRNPACCADSFSQSGLCGV